MWTAEEVADDDETGGKTTARPRRLATRKESPKGGVKWWLAGGEWAAASHLRVGEKQRRERGGGIFAGRSLL
jgi:hypothetical protein